MELSGSLDRLNAVSNRRSVEHENYAILLFSGAQSTKNTPTERHNRPSATRINMAIRYNGRYGSEIDFLYVAHSTFGDETERRKIRGIELVLHRLKPESYMMERCFRR